MYMNNIGYTSISNFIKRVVHSLHITTIETITVKIFQYNIFFAFHEYVVR